MKKEILNKDTFHILAGALLASLVLFIGGAYFMGWDAKLSGVVFVSVWVIYLLFGKWMPRQESPEEMRERVNFTTQRDKPNTL